MSTLVRTLRLRDVSFIFVGAVIGSGIFLVPAGVLRSVGGSPGVALLVWTAGGLLSLLGALTYAELGALKPRAGGLYVYIRDGFGRFPAFLFGWTLFFLISTSSAAALAVAFSAYLGEIVALSPGMARVVSVLMLVTIAAINVRGTRQSANVVNWTTAAKVAGIVLMSAVLMGAGGHGVSASVTLWPGRVDAALISGFFAAMIGVLWAYEGWQYATYSAGEVVDPQRTLPPAFLIGAATLLGVYVLANVGYVAALGPEAAAQAPGIASVAVAVVAGPAAAKLVALMILVSIFSAANSIALTAPRVYYAMARDGVFFEALGRVHAGFGTPAFAILASSAWACLLALTGTFDQLLTYVVFAGWIFYALAAASIFVYRRRLPDADRPYRVPGYPWTPIAFILSAAAVVLSTIASHPGRAAVGIAIVLLGAPAYRFWRGNGRRHRVHA
jgi:basic amino acid/polyamine antiporter, APA family